MKIIDPRKYNLSSRILLQQNSSNHIFIVMDRKSRIIMSDGHRIIKIVKTIQSVEYKNKISVLTSAPVCSKTQDFLAKNKIEINKL